MVLMMGDKGNKVGRLGTHQSEFLYSFALGLV